MTCVLAFDIGLRHFAWTRMSVTKSGRPFLHAMDCHDFGDEPLSTVYGKILLYLETICIKNVDVILVEQQMNRMNIKATKISVCVMTFFMVRFPHLRVIEYASFQKTRLFALPSTSKKERKNACIDFTRSRVFNDDPVALDWLDQFCKQDDICDCVMMTMSYLKKTHHHLLI